MSTVGFTTKPAPAYRSNERADTLTFSEGMLYGGASSPRADSPHRENFRSSPPADSSSSPNRRGDLRSSASYREPPVVSRANLDSKFKRNEQTWKDAPAVGGPSPASPLRSPSLSLSPSRSPPRPSVRFGSGDDTHETNRRRTDSRSRSPLGFSAGGAGADLDSSRVSVDFEQALEQMLTSLNQGASADAPVPVQEVPSASAGRVNHYRPVSAPATSNRAGGSRAEVGYGGYGAAAGTAASMGSSTSSTARISSIQRVDDRLLELKQEKERLRRLLMDRVEDL